MLEGWRSIIQKCRPKVICLLCNQTHEGKKVVCSDCLLFFNPLGPACERCATPILQGSFLVCGRCIHKSPCLNNCYAAYSYEEPLRSIIREFKYRGELYLTQFLANLMLEIIPPPILKTECFIPVPLHSKRLQQRGFNQAAELAKYLGKALAIPVDLFLCEKRVNTLPQADLKGIKRRQNLRDAFFVNQATYENVTLIDDIITTGSTLNELARVLKKAGVGTVNGWGCARPRRYSI